MVWRCDGCTERGERMKAWLETQKEKFAALARGHQIKRSRLTRALADAKPAVPSEISKHERN
jgi:hypothetical protein